MAVALRTDRIALFLFIGLAALAALFVAAVLMPAPGLAQTCTVSSTEDDGANTLRGHLAETDCEVIDFAVTGAIMLDDSLIVGRDVIIEGPGPEGLSVSGGNEVRVFFISSGTTVSISGLTITGGQAEEGGGIYNDVGTVTLTGSTISGNTAGADGGGIYNEGMLTVADSTISGNSTVGEGATGGGISNAGNLTVTDSTISGNSSNFGGGIYNWFGFDAAVTVNESIISGNHGENGGGGIFNESGGFVTVTDTTISGNDNSGIYNLGTVTLARSSISGNSTIGGGAGIFNVFGQITLIESTVSGNHAEGDGGGISNTLDGVMTVQNSTISGNSAEFTGGGILNWATISVASSTVAGNSAGSEGGGISYQDGQMTVKNSIVAQNPQGENCSLLAGAFNTPGDNLADDDSCTGFTQVGNVMLGPLGNNGGPTLTRALLPGSPAVDAVSDCTFVDGVTDVATDQRGAPRPHGPACDVGAFESGAAPVPTLAPGQRFWGDADCDKSVAIGDALKTARHLLGLSVSQEKGCPEIGSEVTADGATRTWGDVDCDGSVAIGDALKIARWLLGLSVSQEEGCPEIGAEVEVAV